MVPTVAKLISPSFSSKTFESTRKAFDMEGGNVSIPLNKMDPLSLFPKEPTTDECLQFLAHSFETIDREAFHYYFDPAELLEGGVRFRLTALTPSELNGEISAEYRNITGQVALLEKRTLTDEGTLHLNRLKDEARQLQDQINRCQALLNKVPSGLTLLDFFVFLIWVVTLILVVKFIANGFPVLFKPSIYVLAQKMMNRIGYTREELETPAGGQNALVVEWLLKFDPFSTSAYGEFVANDDDPSIFYLFHLMRLENKTIFDISNRWLRFTYISILKWINTFANRVDSAIFYTRMASAVAEGLSHPNPELLFSLQKLAPAESYALASVVPLVPLALVKTLAPQVYFNVVERPFGFVFYGVKFIYTALFVCDPILQAVDADFQALRRTLSPAPNLLSITAPVAAPAVSPIVAAPAPPMSPIVRPPSERAASRGRVPRRLGGGAFGCVRVERPRMWLFILTVLFCIYSFAAAGGFGGFDGAARVFDENDLEYLTRRVLQLSLDRDDPYRGIVRRMYASWVGTASESVAYLAGFPFPNRDDIMSGPMIRLRQDLITKLNFNMPWYIVWTLGAMRRQGYISVTQVFFSAVAAYAGYLLSNRRDRERLESTQRFLLRET